VQARNRRQWLVALAWLASRGKGTENRKDQNKTKEPKTQPPHPKDTKTLGARDASYHAKIKFLKSSRIGGGKKETMRRANSWGESTGTICLSNLSDRWGGKK